MYLIKINDFLFKQKQNKEICLHTLGNALFAKNRTYKRSYSHFNAKTYFVDS